MVPAGEVYGWVWYQGGVYRVGNRVGIPGGYTRYPARSRLPEESPRYSEAGPGTPAGGGVGGTWARTLRDRSCVRASEPTLRARSVPLQDPSQVLSLSSGKGRDYGPFSIKLVKTSKCHRKVSKRPAVVPIFQNGSGKSPLEIPGFPFCAAFSPKELMGHN